MAASLLVWQCCDESSRRAAVLRRMCVDVLWLRLTTLECRNAHACCVRACVLALLLPGVVVAVGGASVAEPPGVWRARGTAVHERAAAAGAKPHNGGRRALCMQGGLRAAVCASQLQMQGCCASLADCTPAAAAAAMHVSSSRAGGGRAVRFCAAHRQPSDGAARRDVWRAGGGAGRGAGEWRLLRGGPAVSDSGGSAAC